MSKKLTTLIIIYISLGQPLIAQDSLFRNNALNTNNLIFTPIIALETWGTYSMNVEKNGEHYANQMDVYLRRLRFGAKGQLAPWLCYTFQLHYDRLGENYYASTKGSDKGQIGVWNAYITAKLLKTSDALNMHAGYYWAAISREYNTSPWAVSSFDKTFSVWYLRNFLTATGNGIETGVGLAGIKNFDNKMGLSYRISVHNPKKHNSIHYSNPLYSGRIMLSLGNPEQKKYKYMLAGTQWGKRIGITFGLGASHQGKVDNMLSGSDSVFFDKSIAYGTDMLINYGGLAIDGEYFIMNRTATGLSDFNAYEWHVRISYITKWAKYFIEPSFMLSEYNGQGEKKLYKYIGNDLMYDLGINWYIKKEKIKLSLHYIYQSGLVAKEKGNYLGVAMQFKI